MKVTLKCSDGFKEMVYLEDDRRVIVEYVVAEVQRIGTLERFMADVLGSGKDFYIRNVSSPSMLGFVYKHGMQPIKSLTWDFVRPCREVPYAQGLRSSWEAGMYAD